MMFDNNPKPPPTTLEALASHVPIAILLGGAIAIFIGMHTAATTLVALGAVHLIGALALIGIRNLRRSRRVSANARHQDDEISAEASRP